MSLLSVVALGLLWVIVGLGCWLGYQLLRQNGRIMLRLEALEEQLAQLLPPEPDGLPLGETAPDFELPSLAGGRTAISPGLVDGELLRCGPMGCTPLAHALPRLVRPAMESVIIVAVTVVRPVWGDTEIAPPSVNVAPGGCTALAFSDAGARRASAA